MPEILNATREQDAKFFQESTERTEKIKNKLLIS